MSERFPLQIICSSRSLFHSHTHWSASSGSGPLSHIPDVETGVHIGTYITICPYLCTVWLSKKYLPKSGSRLLYLESKNVTTVTVLPKSLHIHWPAQSTRWSSFLFPYTMKGATCSSLKWSRTCSFLYLSQNSWLQFELKKLILGPASSKDVSFSSL